MAQPARSAEIQALLLEELERAETELYAADREYQEKRVAIMVIEAKMKGLLAELAAILFRRDVTIIVPPLPPFTLSQRRSAKRGPAS